MIKQPSPLWPTPAPTKRSDVMVEVAPDMDLVDYATNFVQFLILREFAKTPSEDETEDLCFCFGTAASERIWLIRHFVQQCA